MYFLQHKLCTRKTELALGMKLTNVGDLKSIFFHDVWGVRGALCIGGLILSLEDLSPRYTAILEKPQKIEEVAQRREDPLLLFPCRPQRNHYQDQNQSEPVKQVIKLVASLEIS